MPNLVEVVIAFAVIIFGSLYLVLTKPERSASRNPPPPGPHQDN